MSKQTPPPPNELKVTSHPTNLGQRSMTIVSASITCYKEKWGISASTRTEDHTEDREQAHIAISLPNGKTFSGSIQDFMAIEAYFSNAREKLMEFAKARFDDKEEEQQLLYTIVEVDACLAMFKK